MPSPTVSVTPNALLEMEEPDEFNLNDTVDCRQLIEERFPAKEVAKVSLSVPAFAKIIDYFIGTLKSKKGPLASWMRTEVLDSGILETKAKRACFLEA